MAAYRGKHSRPASDSPINTENQPASRLQTGRPGRASNGGQSPSPRQESNGIQAQSPIRATRSRRSQGNAVDPDAFQPHEALFEMQGRSRFSKLRIVLIVVFVLIVLGAVAAGVYFVSNAIMEDDGTDVEPGIAVTVVIPEGASTNEIANILKQANVVANAQAFIKEVQARGAEQSLKPGEYELETLMDTTLLINILKAGPIVDDGVRLTIAEGLTAEQTAAVVEEACGIPQADFLARVYAADEYLADYPFLEGVYNNSLEGFLYPKTYSIPEGSTADYVVRVLLDQFALETSNLDLTYASEHGMNLFHVVIVASLIEKETFIPEEKPLIASVIYNRLSDGMRLQIDATVVYALGPDFVGPEVGYADLEIDSPYNTYVIDELPAGPICSPSIESIEAAAHPADTNYFYYVLNSREGFHTFAETSDEFEEAKAEYNRIFGIE